MTVDKQPRALYLADVLAAGFECDLKWYEIEAAKELRQLHKLRGISNALARVRYERIKILTDQRDELLAALQGMVDYYGTASANVEPLDAARTAIAKATGE